MKPASFEFWRGCGTGLSALAVVTIGTGPAWASAPMPAPLVGVTGPVGLLAAGVAYGGYLVFKWYRNRG